MEERVFLGGGGPDYGTQQGLRLDYANRHGLIAGATGTGKTVTVQILAEGFAKAGVPVFLADVKGDLAGLALSGSPAFKLHEAFTKRAATIGFDDYTYEAFPVTFWDLFGEKGHPIRTTVAEMGPLLLARMLNLSEAQEGVLNIAFRLADEEGLALLDLKDLRALLLWVGENAPDLSLRYGHIAAASIGAIQRQLLVLENQGGAGLFGEPALELAADKLMTKPQLYATFLLWLLAELFEEMPEVGDPDKPKLVFFFDEAHLLFDDAPKALIDRVETVARLIRSKGVGVYFCTQNPDDVPPDVLGQLGNRVQHALRAFTARDQKALQRASETYRPNPRFDTAEAIREVGVGEAVTSMLERKGAPGIVERTLIRPPSSRLGSITAEERKAVMATSPVAGKYETLKDRVSAYELLTERAGRAAREAAEVEVVQVDQLDEPREFNAGRRYSADRSPTRTERSYGRSRRMQDDTIGGALSEALKKELRGTTGRRLVRGLFGSLFKGR